MKYKIFIFFLIIILICLIIPQIHISSQEEIDTPSTNLNSSSTENINSSGYDYIIGKDLLPHFRVFFWVPKDVVHFTPYANAGVKTDVSRHGPAEKWAVVDTQKVSGDKKLIFVYVPKTFVFLYGSGFEKVIHVKY